MRADGETDITKLLVVFHNFANERNKKCFQCNFYDSVLASHETYRFIITLSREVWHSTKIIFWFAATCEVSDPFF